MPLEARVRTDYILNPSMALLLGFEPRQHYERALANAMSCLPVHCICSPQHEGQYHFGVLYQNYNP